MTRKRGYQTILSANSRRFVGVLFAIILVISLIGLAGIGSTAAQDSEVDLAVSGDTHGTTSFDESPTDRDRDEGMADSGESPAASTVSSSDVISTPYSPNEQVSVTEGDRLTFTVEAEQTALFTDLEGVDWYVNGVYIDTDPLNDDYVLEDFGYTFYHSGTYTIEADVYDENNEFNDEAASWEVEVNEPANPDSWADAPDQQVTVVEGQDVTFTVGAEHDNGELQGAEWYVDSSYQAVTYGLNGYFDTDTWSKTFNEPGVYTIEADVFDEDDDYNDDAAQWTITVEEAEPVSWTEDPDEEITIEEGEDVTFTVGGQHTAEDLQGVEWYVDNSYEGVTWGLEGGLDTDDWTRTFDEPGTYTVEADVFDHDDDYNDDAAEWTVTVEESPVPESWADAPDREVTVVEGQDVTFTVGADHEDGELQGAEWYIDGIDQDVTYGLDGYSDTDTWSETFTEPGTYIIEADVFDEDDEYNDDAAQWTITVEEAEPVSWTEDPDEEITIEEGEDVTFTVGGQHTDEDLQGTEWYIDREYQETTWGLEGGLDTDDWTRTFDEPGTYTVEADVFDHDDDYNEDAAEWTVTVEESPVPVSWSDDPAEEVSIIERQTLDFTVSAEHEDGELQGAEWYVDGDYQEVTYGFDGDADSDSWSKTFDEPGTYTIEADVFDEDDEYNNDAATWVVTVEEGGPPVEELRIDVVSINDKNPDDGVFEYGDIERAVTSVELEITGPNGEPIPEDTLDLDVPASGFAHADSLRLERVDDTRFEAGFDISRDLVAEGRTSFLELSVSYPGESDVQRERVSTVYAGDDLAQPIDRWAPTGERHEVSVDNDRYTVLQMERLDAHITSWLVLTQEGTIVTDEETYQKAAQTAHVSGIEARAGDSRQEGLEELSEEYDELPDNVNRAERVAWVRDKLAEAVGVVVRVKSGGLSEVKSELAQHAVEDVARDLLDDIIIEAVGTVTNEHGQVITSGLLEDDPIGSLDAMMKEQSEVEIEQAGDAAGDAAAVLEERDRSEPWTYEEANEFWEAEEQAVSGTLYSTMRVNMLPEPDARSQLHDISVAVTDGATGSAEVGEVDRMVTLVQNGGLGYVSTAMEETAAARAHHEEEAEAFTVEANRVRNATLDRHEESDVLLDSSTVAGDLDASIRVVEEPSGDYVSGESVNTTVEITNYGDETQQFFAGYSTEVTTDGETEYFDNNGQTGDFIDIAPGETREMTLTWEVQSTAPVTDGYGIVVAVWSDFPERADVDRINDERRSNVFDVTEGADITLDSMQVSETTVTIGEYVDVQAIYRNDGEEAGTETAELTIDGESVTRSTVDVAPGTESTGLGHSFDEPGVYELSVDQEETVEIEVVDAEPTVVDTDITPTDGEAPVTVEAEVDVENAHAVSVSEVFHLYVDGEWVDSDSVSLDPDATGTATLEYLIEDPGEYEVSVDDKASETIIVEPGETDEPAFDTAVDWTPLEQAEPGVPATVQVSVENTGNASGELTLPLTIGDEEVDVDSVTVHSGEHETIELTHTFADAGEYDVQVGEEHATTISVTEESEGVVVDVQPTRQQVGIDEPALAGVTVTGADEGVAAYTVTVSVNDSVTEITDVTLAGDPAETFVDISEDGSVVEVTVLDVSLENDVVDLFGVALNGVDIGTSAINVDVEAISTPDGSEYEIAAVGDGDLEVVDISPVGDFDDPPNDLDGDGLYRDVNGNGQSNIADVQALFAHTDDPTVQNNVEKFDFTDTGDVNVADVQALFAEVTDDGGDDDD